MKKLTLLTLVGITSIVLAHAGWAAGHGGGGFGGGGGFHGGGFGGGGFRGAGFGGGGFHGGGFRGGNSHFNSMRGGQFFHGGAASWRGRNWSGHNWNGRGWSGNWGRHNHRFSNDVIFIGDFGFPGWWGWGYPYGYYDYGYDDYPYDYYPYGYYGGPGYGYRYGDRTYLRGRVSQSGRTLNRQHESRRHISH